MELNGIQTGRAALALVAVLAAAMAAELAWDACMAGVRRAQLHEARVEALRAAKEGEAVAETAASGWGEVDAEFWSRFKAEGDSSPEAAGPLAGRYRLAGVFRMLAGGGDGSCAILDDVKSGRQLLLAQGEEEDGLRVEQVGADFAVVSDGTRRERLAIAPGVADGEGEPAARAEAEPVQTVISTNRFGARVGETRWEFSRDAVMEYYQEMMDHPDRLVGLFNALEPDYGEDERIEGYRVNTARGEAEFFDEVGLKQGDVVRRVNSLHMTSQRRAEFFIGEFVKGRLGAVVLDIEREGKPEKLIYLIK